MKIKIANPKEREEVLALRFEVFVDEQQVPPEIEMDAEDAHALHIMAEEQGIAVGCARVLFDGTEAHIGRLAVKKIYRGTGIGSAICRFIIDLCRERGCRRIWLNSQLQAMDFYKKLGFCPKGDVFMEAGIPHVEMELVSREREKKMRTCIRCNTEMIEGLELRTNDAVGVSLGEKGLFKGSLGKVRAAACPTCGYVETYVENTEKLVKKG